MTSSGEAHFKHKLTWPDITYIRAHPELNNAELARRFAVERSTVRLIRANVTWRDPDYTPFENPFSGAGYKDGQRPPEVAR